MTVIFHLYVVCVFQVGRVRMAALSLHSRTTRTYRRLPRTSINVSSTTSQAFLREYIYRILPDYCINTYQIGIKTTCTSGIDRGENVSLRHDVGVWRSEIEAAHQNSNAMLWLCHSICLSIHLSIPPSILPPSICLSVHLSASPLCPAKDTYSYARS